jgi:hypothetical protein
MKISVSAMRDWLKCPQLAYNVHVLHRGPERRAVPLDVGTLFHEAMANRLGGAPRVLGPELGSWLTVSEDAREVWAKHQLWLPANQWTPDPAWKVLGTEVVLESEIGCGHTLVGTVDAPLIWNGKIWSGQWKTFDGGSEPEWALLNLQEKVRLSYHEVAYQWLIERTLCQEHNLPYGGVILGACEKLPGYRIINKQRAEITDGDRAGALTFHYLFRSPQQQQALWADTQDHLIYAANASADGPNYQPKNLDTCFGPFGRSRCPFFAVCHEGADINSPPLVDLKARY